MTQYAPVGNLHVHQQLYGLGYLGDYHLLLAHQIAARPQEYQRFWHRFIDGTGISRLDITVDNSVVELGEAMSMEKVIAAATVVGATTIVLPDVINDARRTLEQAEISFEDHVEELEENGIGALGIAQGRDVDEVLECAAGLVALGVRRLGISKYLVDTPVGSRVAVAKALGKAHELPIHLFGFSNNMVDDLTAARQPYVIGIDSAMPIWLGLAGRVLPDTAPVDASNYGRRPEDYDDEERPIQYASTQNVQRVREWLSAL